MEECRGMGSLGSRCGGGGVVGGSFGSWTEGRCPCHLGEVDGGQARIEGGVGRVGGGGRVR